MPACSRSSVLFSRGSYLAVVFRRAPLAGLSWSRRREHERVSLASADSARFGLKGEERTDDTPPRDRIFQEARSVVPLFPSNIAARSFSSRFLLLVVVVVLLLLLSSFLLSPFFSSRASSLRRDLLIRSFALTFTSVFQRESSVIASLAVPLVLLGPDRGGIGR